MIFALLDENIAEGVDYIRRRRGRDFLKPSEEFGLVDEKEVLLLRPVVPKPVGARSRKKVWAKETFLDAGEVAFIGFFFPLLFLVV